MKYFVYFIITMAKIGKKKRTTKLQLGGEIRNKNVSPSSSLVAKSVIKTDITNHAAKLELGGTTLEVSNKNGY
jgi:hypothetical protein